MSTTPATLLPPRHHTIMVATTIERDPDVRATLDRYAADARPRLSMSAAANRLAAERLTELGYPPVVDDRESGE